MKPQSAIEALIKDELTRELTKYMKRILYQEYGKYWWEKGVVQPIEKNIKSSSCKHIKNKKPKDIDFSLAMDILFENIKLIKWNSDLSFDNLWHNVKNIRNRWVGHSKIRDISYDDENIDIMNLLRFAQALKLNKETVHKLEVLKDLRYKTEKDYKGPITSEELAKALKFDTPHRFVYRVRKYIPVVFREHPLIAVVFSSIAVLTIVAVAAYRISRPDSPDVAHENTVQRMDTIAVQPPAPVNTAEHDIHPSKRVPTAAHVSAEGSGERRDEQPARAVLTRAGILRLLTGDGDVQKAYPRYARWSQEQVAADLSRICADRAELRRHVSRWKLYIIELQQYSTDRLCNTVMSLFGDSHE